jgi:hypothetical protein
MTLPTLAHVCLGNRLLQNDRPHMPTPIEHVRMEANFERLIQLLAQHLYRVRIWLSTSRRLAEQALALWLLVLRRESRSKSERDAHVARGMP